MSLVGVLILAGLFVVCILWEATADMREENRGMNLAARQAREWQARRRKGR